MLQEPLSTPYTVVYHLLVQHFNQTTDKQRFQWLETDALLPLIPYLITNQSAVEFVHDLLRISYLERDQTTDPLRALLLHLRQTYIGFSDIVGHLDIILSSPDPRRVLFPAGVPDTDNPALMRALALFQRLPNDLSDPLPDIAPLPPPHYVRLDRNIDFVGREMELKTIARAIKEQRGVAVAAGIGGVGKTQTAIEWVHRYGQFFAGGVFWLDFSDPEVARLSIATAGTSYGWEGYEALDLEIRLARVQRQWNEPIPTLLIFDNCDDATLADHYLPVGSGARVLLTSRDTTWKVRGRERGIRQVDIITLPRQDSIVLLQSLCPTLDEIHADGIADLVGDLPLALHLAGIYLAKYRRSIFGNPATYIEALQANLLAKLEKSGKRVSSLPSPTDHSRSIRATFDLSWQRLQAQADTVSPLAEKMIGLIAQFAPGAGIPEAWLWETLPEAEDEQDGLDAKELLQSIGLVEVMQEAEVRLHRLIAEVVKEHMDEQKTLEAGGQVQKVLVALTPSFGTLDFIPLVEQWLPHAQYCSADAVQRGDQLAACLLNQVGLVLLDLAIYEEALPYLTKALTIYKAVLGIRHLDTALCMSNLAALYDSQGEYKQALPLYEEALAIRKSVLGSRHPNTAMSLNNLGYLYQAQGEYGQALPLFEEALEIHKAVFGIHHPDTAMSLNNLGYLYQEQGEYGRALPLLEDALNIHKAMLGSHHLNTARSLNNLAMLYQAQGEYEQALPLVEEALEIYTAVLGSRHPDTARSLNNLGTLYQAQGEYRRALPLLKEALEISKAVLGSRHPDTATRLNNLGILYQEQGEYGRALRLFEEALAIRKAVLGSGHPDTSGSLNTLAYFYRTKGEYEQALPLYKEALAIQKATLGNRHPDTALSLNNLAELYQAKEEYGQALPLYEEAISIFTATLGQAHPNTLIVRENQDQCRQMLESDESPSAG
jgi:tetratricopeptide (TPR) repeat protein